MAKALLYDSTLCIGCRRCEGACSKKWGLPYNEKIAQQETISAHKLTAVQTFGARFSRRLCMHCVEPTCVSVCPVGALQKTALGAVIDEEPRCIGCRYCYEWNHCLPRMKKCNLCHERQVVGKATACSEICPTNATITGEREGLIAEARKRLAEKPTEYYQRIYGVREVGGISVLYILAVPFEQIGLKTNLPQEALPALTWRALSLVPNVATLGGALLGGVYWITHRREEVAAAEGRGRSTKGGRS